MAKINPGNILNERFLLINKLGAGSFGITFHAFDLELKTNVVIKFLQNAAPSPDEESLLISEEKRVSALRSPYIVKSLGYFPSKGDNGAGLISFEYLEGATQLDQIANILRADPEIHVLETFLLIITFLAQAADGLGALHNIGIIHRDIKPENIIVDASQRAKIIDFGLAIHDYSEEAKQFSGTLHTMAPEIKKKGASIQSDVYSLGVTMFYVVLERWPGLNLPVDFLQMTGDIIPRSVAEQLNNIFLKATHINPDERYIDGREMAQALWEVVMELRAIRDKRTDKKIAPLQAGHVTNLEAAIKTFNSLCLDNEIVRHPHHRLDGLILPRDERFKASNRIGAFIFDYDNVQYQINADTLRSAMYRLSDYAERARKTKTPPEQLLTPITTSDGTRALRLSSYLADNNGLIPANGFYCYACDDLAKLNING